MGPKSERKPKNTLREALASTGLPANGSSQGCDVSTTGAQPQQPLDPMTTINSRLRLALLNRRKGQNLLEKGFTLVELMVVIVIVGILSSVALPQFLNQGTKAKGSEGRSDIASIIKNAAVEYQQGGGKYITELGTKAAVTGTGPYSFAATNTTCDGFSGRAATVTQKFDYYCELTQAVATDPYLTANTYTVGDYVLVVTALGDANDTALTNKVIQQAHNLDNGSSNLVSASTCRVFGGTATGNGTTGVAPTNMPTAITTADCT